VVVDVPSAIRVEPASVAIARLDERPRFAATVLSDHGTPMAGRPVTFSVSDPDIATVDESGIVTGIKTGSTIITVASGDLASQVKVDVALAANKPAEAAPAKIAKRTPTHRRSPRR